MPVIESLPLPPAITVMVTVPVVCPSETVIANTAVPVRPATAAIETLRLPPLPDSTTLLFGTSCWLLEAADNVRSASAVSASARVSGMLPELSSGPQLPGESTVTVGASSVAVTVQRDGGDVGVGRCRRRRGR